MGFKSSVQQAMTRGFRNISVEKIRINPENFYAQTDFEQEAIDQMADLLNENGQDANILVFADPQDDGKEYTLLSGERRYKAVLKLVSEGKSDGMIQAKIEDAPESKSDEMLRLIRGNAQRTKTKDIRIQEVKSLQAIWEEMKKSGTAEGRFVDWAGKNIGMSARQISNYLKEAAGTGGTVEPETTEDETDQEQLKLEEFLSALSRELKDHTNGQIRVNKKMQLQVRNETLTELAHHLECLECASLAEMVKKFERGEWK
ncbi:ParB N-terminal domain-containing protein [Faecalibaculum rodentium]|uniref:ParB-like N-terminal domain-containing protein n=2 Tax=Faecalibaculum rodentium TaxID=1702221 RepID=A0A140DT06_9FIRM|nr:ParB N-terminal domain-containing protein [Faecalibaculum rodentium]AMK53783.1 hypothetical protein AALO17_06490 [Faecalibaculum rodentium]OLU43592.1 hypothetical protein BO223_11515 [Faecalibaculum rodentium]